MPNLRLDLYDFSIRVLGVFGLVSIGLALLYGNVISPTSLMPAWIFADMSAFALIFSFALDGIRAVRAEGGDWKRKFAPSLLVTSLGLVIMMATATPDSLLFFSTGILIFIAGALWFFNQYLRVRGL
jgi:hypothetical protein